MPVLRELAHRPRKGDDVKLSRQASKELAIHREKVKACVERVEHEIALVPNRLNDSVVDLNAALVDYVAAVEATNAFIGRIGAELRDEFDDKSEKWKDSDAGQSASEMVDAWESGVSYDAIPVKVLVPDFPTPSITVEELDDLPEESE